MTDAISRGKVTANGLEFDFLESGRGPLALCLHGFPDSAWSWTAMLANLAAAGYHAVAPWMRGYAPTEIPADGRYDIGALAEDCKALHAALGADENAIIIGHDWGAMAAYGAIASQPNLWHRCVILATPPPVIAMRGFQNYEQVRCWWHLFFFQTPMADALLEADDLALVEKLWRDWSPGFEPGAMIDRAKDALRGEGRIRAALGYYRALFTTGGLPLTGLPVPTLLLYGIDDRTLWPSSLIGAENFLAPGSKCIAVRDAGHFLHLERPRVVMDEIMSFIS